MIHGQTFHKCIHSQYKEHGVHKLKHGMLSYKIVINSYNLKYVFKTDTTKLICEALPVHGSTVRVCWMKEHYKFLIEETTLNLNARHKDRRKYERMIQKCNFILSSSTLRLEKRKYLN